MLVDFSIRNEYLFSFMKGHLGYNNDIIDEEHIFEIAF
jgi:hypothetical protein